MTMTYYDIVRKYGRGKGEDVMLASVQSISTFIEGMKEGNPAAYWGILKETYANMNGKHYDEYFGQWQIEQMSWRDKCGVVHRCPHWNKDAYHQVYENNKGRLKDRSYTCWDMAVTLEMTYSDNICLLKEWFPEATPSELDAKCVCLAINYLNDDDDAAGGKIWRRFNG